MSKGWMYILECSNGAYYTGSTNNLELRVSQHQNGEGANFTKKHLPVKLVYCEEFPRIDEAFYREKQVQGWGRKKKEALISGFVTKLHNLAECKNDTHFSNVPFDSAQGTERSLSEAPKVPFGSAQGTDRSLSEAPKVPFDSAQGTGRSLSGAETTGTETPPKFPSTPLREQVGR